MTGPRDIGCRDDGFTLVELLVAMTISLIVLLATLQSLDLFTSNAAHQTRVTDANDQVRRVMDRTVRDLRGASAIAVAGSTNLVYSIPTSPTSVRTERLCVESTDLFSFTTQSPAPPPTSAMCSTGSRVANLRTSATAFTYDSTNVTLIKNVGLIFSLEATTGTKTTPSTLKASAAVRKTASTLAIGPGDTGVVCSKDGPRVQLLVGLPTDLGPLTVTYKANGGISVDGGNGTTPVTLPPSVTSFVTIVTDSLGITRAEIKKEVGCIE